MLKNKNQIYYLLLGIILLLSLFLRIYKLSDFPVGFHIDEASLGYNGYSLLLTGRDENSQSMPLYIDMFGDNRPSGYHYLTIIPVKFFGLTEFSTRLPAAIFGAISIFPIFLFVNTIFRNRTIAILASLFVAISPWHIVISRASGEAIVALFFILFGFSLLIQSIRNQSKITLIFASLLLPLSYFFYHTPRMFVPLFFVSLIVFLNPVLRNINSKTYLFNLFCSLFFTGFVAVLLVFFISGGTGRFSQVNIFSHPETRLIMNEQIREDGMQKNSILETRVVHNKLINYALTFTSNYLTYFSGEFLFIKGGLPIWYNVPNMGLLYIVFLPFILLGAILLFQYNKLIYKVPLFWILIAPVTSAITVDDIPNINRVIVLFPMLEILAAYGIYNFINNYKGYLKNIFITIISLALIYNFYYFWHQYFMHTRSHRTWYRNNGFKVMMETVKSNYDKYDKVIITKSTGGVYPLVLFYMQYDPKIYQQEKSPKGPDYGGFGKFYFVPQDCPTRDKDERFPKTGKILFVNKGDCGNVKNVNFTDIFREDGTRAFRIQL